MDKAEALELMETACGLIVVLSITLCIMEAKTPAEREWLARALSSAIGR